MHWIPPRAGTAMRLPESGSTGDFTDLVRLEFSYHQVRSSEAKPTFSGPLLLRITYAECWASVVARSIYFSTFLGLDAIRTKVSALILSCVFCLLRAAGNVCTFIIIFEAFTQFPGRPILITRESHAMGYPFSNALIIPALLCLWGR